jgi:DNA-binding transcriptional LysR family regulator
VLPSSHPLARRHEIDIAELSGERFNAPPSEGFTLPYRTMFERLCREVGFEPNVAYVLRDVTVARAFVAAGLCVSLMPELTLPELHTDVAVRPIRGIDPFRSLYATWLRGRRVPSLPEMVRYLAHAARARLA